MKLQRGAFVLGLVVGLLLGLALALGVALYITRAPVPFVNKVPQRTAEQDSAEAARNRTWDPNAGLGGRPAARPAAGGASGAVGPSPAAPGAGPAPQPAAGPGGVMPATPRAQAATPPAAPTPAVRDPAAILSSGSPPAAGPSASAPRSTAAAAEPFVFYVQAGAFTRTEEAEQQKAKLALMGHVAAISEREQAGRTVYRVRLGPMRTREEADALQVKLQTAGMETQIVRVEKP